MTLGIVKAVWLQRLGAGRHRLPPDLSHDDEITAELWYRGD